MNSQESLENEKTSFIDEEALELMLTNLQTSKEDIFPIKLMSPEGIDGAGKSAALLRREITLTLNSSLRALRNGQQIMAGVIVTYLVEVGFQIGMSHACDKELFNKLKQEAMLKRLEP